MHRRNYTRTPLRLAIDATMLARGGGLNGLVNYLAAWRELQLPLKTTVYATRKDVLEAVQQNEPSVHLIPFAQGKNAIAVYRLRQRMLGKIVDNSEADVLLTTNSLTGTTAIPQVVHHQNLNCFTPYNFWTELNFGGLRWAVKGYFIRRAAKTTLAKSAANLFVSDYVRQLSEKIVPDDGRNYTVHNGISARLIAAAKKTHVWEKSANIAAVTSDNPHKSNPVLIKMLAELSSRSPDANWRLRVAGRGDYKIEKQLAVDLKVDSQIEWCGFLTAEAMELLFHDSLCLAFTSPVEAFGNPPLEAMARSCPVVASDSTAIPEVCGDCAQLVPPENSTAFATAVQKYYLSPDFRNDSVTKGLRRVRDFTWENSAKKMFDVIKSVAESPQ